MIRDAAAKLLLIPALGMCISILTMALSLSTRSVTEILLSILFWTSITCLLWQGIVAVTAFIRNHSRIRQLIPLKLILLLFATAIIALLITRVAVSLWNKLFQNPIPYKNTSGYAFVYLALAPIIGLSYEILFLLKEQELDSKIVAQLDYERQSAELQALNSELEPHFIFNALNVLSPLIATDSLKAQTFTNKLTQVYKYLLQNKDRELVSLRDELRFIQDYFYLLQIRHENMLRLNIALHNISIDQIMILPFALQVLVENAIKHNHFTEEKPLSITISLNKQFIRLCNTIYPKPYAEESTNVGLKNLSARYKLISNKDIIIYQTTESYIVKVPVLKTTL